MRRSTLFLMDELAKALLSTPVGTGEDLPAAAGGASISPPARQADAALISGKRTGRIVEWDPFGRRGVILEREGGRRYIIANTRAFETVLPTMLRTLEGAAVKFDVDRQASADRVIIRNRVTPITAESYRQRPPIDFLSPEMLKWAGPRGTALKQNEVRSYSGEKRSGVAEEVNTAVEAEELFARNILVDVSSIPAAQVARWSGPLSEEAVIKPTKNLKDMRSSRLFDAETNAYLRLTQKLGSTAAARRMLGEQREQATRNAVRREVIAEKTEGIIVAWSSIHRSGLIREGKAPQEEQVSPEVKLPDSLDNGDGAAAENFCIIRNVHAFQSALPTSQSLRHRRVTFTKVSYAAHSHRCYAESIVVDGDVRYDAAAPSLEEARAMKEREKAAATQLRHRRALFMEDDGDWSVGSGERQPIGAQRCASGGLAEKTSVKTGASSLREEDGLPSDPDKVLYGVVVRWSGGQGIIESGDGRHFYLRSAADFEQLVDKSSHHLRGAIVQFKQDMGSPRYARQVDILSTASTTIGEVRPLLEKTQFSAFVADSARATRDVETVTAVSKVAPEGVEWAYGTLLSWSSVEGQGIIVGEANEVRYVLRDPEENVVDYTTNQALLRKGRRIKFTPFGSSGRLACNVVLLLEAEAAEESLAKKELRPKEPQLSMDGNKNEAIPSPMSTSYWLRRMDKAGYDTREVKRLQNRALRLDEDDDGDDGTEGGKLLDSEELLKRDHWWSDPRKNVRFPNSDMTAGHLALIGPASMMNVAMKSKDPKKLDKMLKKYQSRLTEEQKEYAWRQAKEMAPKYEECIRKGRERNEEPTFYFF
ncbi:hypothetical protein LSCM1_02028 [Leishmania martiniquensis]|uniref:Uncharacterized protein n=1 Tax=Leishmania martiniquensis TaxID=1580590 RepID=A0A836GVW7_9TRYP|nr:hypothetical protein LSCM1_02028 [Leishmania martiniquensis]